MRSTTRARLALCRAVSSDEMALIRDWAEWQRSRVVFVDGQPEPDGWFSRAIGWLRG
jgi:hypothetical protein